jgi:hypothetical protein
MKIKLNVVLTIVAIPLFLLGLGMTIATSTILGNFGHDVNPSSIHFARADGGAVLGLAIMTWLARNSGPSQARNALVAGLSLFFLLEAVVDFRAIINGTYGQEAWFTGVIPWLIFFALTVLAGRSAMAEES